MPNFINPVFLNPNISQLRFTDKIKLTKQDISIQFLLATDIGHTYKVIYIITINSSVRQRDPSVPYSPINIDMESLRSSIMEHVRPYDREYMILQKFDHRKAEFHLNTKKWIKDATNGLTPTTHISKFDRAFKLKKEPPKMIMQDFMRAQWAHFVVRKFKKWLEDQRKEAQFFKYLIPESLRSKIRTRIRDMFKWYYDIQWNTVVAKLKPIWIIAFLYATGTILRKMRETDLNNKSKKELFAVKVKKNMPQFDDKKWKKFIQRRFI
ncbi:MAG TPA: hypothetical protein VMZ91_13100 [Candidatus Paceibacterota bacterium]|nr:hypothetical protein [Candidatus Paceibacterota bacterium]